LATSISAASSLLPSGAGLSFFRFSIARRTFLGWQIEQYHRYFGVQAVGRDLRAHHAGAEDGDFFNDEIRHLFLLGQSVGSAGPRRWRQARLTAYLEQIH